MYYLLYKASAFKKMLYMKHEKYFDKVLKEQKELSEIHKNFNKILHFIRPASLSPFQSLSHHKTISKSNFLTADPKKNPTKAHRSLTPLHNITKSKPGKVYKTSESSICIFPNYLKSLIPRCRLLKKKLVN